MSVMNNLPAPGVSGVPVQILAIDDEAQIRRFLDISLRAQGYRTLLAENARTGLEKLAAHGADLVILDLGLPDMDGLEALQEIRKWSQVPIIVLTVRAREIEKVSALDKGANDYVTKPFGIQELMARIRALLRGRGNADDVAPVFDDGRLHIDAIKREVSVDGMPVTLGRKEFALLVLLLTHSGRIVTRARIIRELWGPGHHEDTHYLRILTAKLRSKLKDSAAAPRYIATEPGVGLRFVGQHSSNNH
jgi:two-component system KDP operon response regulator KdpE